MRNNLSWLPLYSRKSSRVTSRAGGFSALGLIAATDGVLAAPRTHRSARRYGRGLRVLGLRGLSTNVSTSARSVRLCELTLRARQAKYRLLPHKLHSGPHEHYAEHLLAHAGRRAQPAADARIMRHCCEGV